MATFQDKITNLKTLLIEDGVGEVLEQLKLLLANNKTLLNKVFLLGASLQEYNDNLGFGLITREEYSTKLVNLRKTILTFLDDLTPQDVEASSGEKSKKKKKRGHLLQRIPNKMQLLQRTKCVIRLAHLQEDLLENYKMTDDTIIKSIRIAEVMEVDLQDRNESKAFEIETINSNEQIIDEDDYTEWLFYVKPIREGEHQLTLLISVLEEVRGKERRKDVVLEEVVTIVTENPIVDELYKSTGYEVNSTKTLAPQPFSSFMKNMRKYSAVVVVLILGTIGTWALGQESIQHQILSFNPTPEKLEAFIVKYEDNPNSKYVEMARWDKAMAVNTMASYNEYLNETTKGRYNKEAEAKIKELEGENPNGSGNINNNEDTTGTTINLEVEARNAFDSLITELKEKNLHPYTKTNQKQNSAYKIYIEAFIKLVEKYPTSHDISLELARLYAHTSTPQNHKENHEEELIALKRICINAVKSEKYEELETLLSDIQYKKTYASTDNNEVLSKIIDGHEEVRTLIKSINKSVKQRTNESTEKEALLKFINSEFKIFFEKNHIEGHRGHEHH